MAKKTEEKQKSQDTKKAIKEEPEEEPVDEKEQKTKILPKEKAATAVSKPHWLIPSIVLAVISILLGFLSARNGVGTLPAVEKLLWLLRPTAALAVMFALVGIAGAVSLGVLPVFIASALGVAVFAFIMGVDVIGWIIGLGIALSITFYYKSVESESKARVRFSIRKSMRNGLGFSIMIIISLLAIGVFFNEQAAVSSGNVKVPDSLKQFATGMVPGDIMTQSLGCSPDITIDECKTLLISTQLNATGKAMTDIKGGCSPDLTMEECKKVIEGAVPKNAGVDNVPKVDEAQLRQGIDEQFSQIFGADVSGSTKIKDAMGNLVGNKIDELAAPVIKYLPFIYAGAVFFLLLIIKPFFKLLVKILGSILFGIFRISGLIVKEKRMVELTVMRLR